MQLTRFTDYSLRVLICCGTAPRDAYDDSGYRRCAPDFREPLDESGSYALEVRIRCENEVGFKMVKGIAYIEFVQDYADLGAGEGRYNEDHEFFGYRVPI